MRSRISVCPSHALVSLLALVSACPGDPSMTTAAPETTTSGTEATSDGSPTGQATEGPPTTTNVPTTSVGTTDDGTTTETSATTDTPVTATETDAMTESSATESSATETGSSSSGETEEPSLVGTLGDGDDPCAGGDGRSWTTFGRCNARTNRSLVLSAQMGEDVELMRIDANFAADSAMAQPVFGMGGTAYVTNVWLTAIGPDWSELFTVDTDVNAVVAPDGTFYTAFTETYDTMPEVNARAPDGSVLWTRDLTGAPWPPMVLSDGTLLFLGHRSQTDDLALQALEPNAGADVWSYSFGPGDILDRGSLLASSTDEVYVRTRQGHLVAIDAITHEPRWDTSQSFSEVALDEAGGRLATRRGIQEGNYSYEEFGKVDVATGAYEPVLTLPVMCGGCDPSAFALAKGGWVHFSYVGTLFAVNLDDPDATWELETGSTSDPVIGGDGTIYVAIDDEQQNLVTAVHADGTLRWTTVLEDNVEPSSWAGTYLSIDPQGPLLVAFAENQTVYRVNR
ncbi:PQQ-binding-like beta-propeller repeat protein [Nannocystis sp. SCPEA4]|uniref:outer membrane protein assembly factor BamB family protein n=1 Tax=Nannocystis sp. SCPEA4 TaxID=2996787 RepID=UPI00226E6B7B|nr:PQQ-binding-like beta-propeller repeat protein [Nannocystis sp. SCPEA4]MCY1056446.1 PQQ-binding-like beta-propeller repeat protein [Nannocystis sp. SCPEA4]